jgi:D-alanyl-D-alanine carboxypeptidase/D-alanyl-D-alanine-endopeptidase (penicillin-binding protein 4)
MKIIARLVAFCLAIILSIAPANAALGPDSIPAVFSELLKNPSLSNPAMIVIDESTGKVIYEHNPDSQRKPASVMKILSASATLEYLDPNASFNTAVSILPQSKTIVIRGSFDPWISLDDKVAKKMHRTSLPFLAFNTMSAIKKVNSGTFKGYSVIYSGLYSQDVGNLKAFWKKRSFNPVMKQLNQAQGFIEQGDPVASQTSPTVTEILDWTMLWSDNLLAERLARLSSKAAGNSFDDQGVATTFHTILNHFEIDSSHLVVKDASGLSKENRITARLMGELLLKLRKDEKFSLLYNSLPVAGVSGTLKDRFITTAPSAVGLIRAKTGTLNGTATLAGFVQSTDREYVFVLLADEIAKGNTALNKARAAIDRVLGRIAAPNIPTEIIPAP